MTIDSKLNDKIAKLFNKNDFKLEQLLSKLELDLFRIYKRSLDEVQKIILGIFEKYGDNPDITQLRKYGRLTTIEKQLVDEIKSLTNISANLIGSHIKEIYPDAYYQTAFILETGTGINFGFTLLPKEAIKFAIEDNLWLDSLKDANAKLLSDVKREFETLLRTNARAEIVAGLSQGKPYAQIAKGIKERFNVSASRAKTITRTEMHKAYSFGRNEGITRAQEAGKRIGITVLKVWQHNPVAKEPRQDHIRMGNPEYKNHVAKDGVFTLPSGVQGEAPGLTGDPSEDISCSCNAESVLEGITPDMQDKELMKQNYDEWKSKL